MRRRIIRCLTVTVPPVPPGILLYNAERVALMVRALTRTRPGR